MMKWINAGDIKNWMTGKQRHCQQTLPELVRRLIFATASTIEDIDFPGDDSIATGGWDGHLKTPVVSPFFPSGISGWEIGMEASPGKKAEEDYTKRTADPLGLPLHETTFVFVTPRSWPGRGKWQNGKRAAGTWKDVRVIAADGLEQWLDSAPAVALWLGRQIKGLSDNIRDIEGFWEEWSVATAPTMTTDIVICGRTREIGKIHRWIIQKPGILEVRGDSPDEPFAFLYASIANLPQTEQLKALTRCIIVENIQQLRSCALTFQSPLIIAAPADCREAVALAVEKGHHIFLSADAKSIDFRDNLLELSRPKRSIVENNLHLSGLSELEAQQLARDFGRSIPVLRRHLFRSSARTPAWTNAESARLLIPVLFTGAWNEQKDGDREVVETLSGMNYAAFVKELTPFLPLEDSPIRKIGSVWMLKSPSDAWFLLASHLTDDFLKLFEQSILAVLTKTDLKYELPAEQRWAAAIYGKATPYSEWLKTGLVESLVLVAVYGNRSSDVVSTQAFADHVVRKVFATADKWEAWASVKEVTPLLAEAAPDTFMEVVEQSIEKNPTLFQELMQDDIGFFGECRHSGLLWAFEGIVWSSEYFARAVSGLFKLAKIDQGGKWGNRAINSLRGIFLAGLPQTYATAEERLTVLDSLIALDSQLVWKFAQSYYASGHISESHRFRWRDAGGNRRGLEREDIESYRKYTTGLLPKLSDLACARENLISTADDFTRLPAHLRARLLAELEAINPATFSSEKQRKLSECIREALNWTNSYGEKERLDQVPALYRVLERFTPADVIERVGWLLSTPWPRLPEGEPKGHEEKEIVVKKAQGAAAREVLDEASIVKIIEFASTVPYPGVLGHALGKAVRDEKKDGELLDAMLEHALDLSIFIQEYAEGRVELDGPGWIDKQINRLKAKGNYSAEACALLYFGLPEGAASWSAVSERGKDVENAYWKQARGHSRTSKSENSPIAVEKLLDAERPDAALRIAGDSNVSIPSTLLRRLIQEILTLDEKKFRVDVMEEYHLGQVFKQLYERNELSIEEIAKLEWPFAPLFKDFKRHISTSMALHRVLQKDPLFFAQLISFIYKRDDRTPDPIRGDVDETIVERQASIAQDVLDSWQLMPGLADDGKLDEKELIDWVEAARKQCSETNHVAGGDRQIALMIAHSPDDSDGTWPHVAVRNLIERLSSGFIEDHIQTGIYNSRGFVSYDLKDGGKHERELAERYRKMSEAVKVKWPRTAAMLRSIANSYERDAQHEDIDSDLRDERWY